MSPVCIRMEEQIARPEFEIIEELFCFDREALFMKAYFDESGKHDPAETITIAGLLMSAKTCKELQRRWLREAAREPTIPLPFHMSDCVNGSKLFKHLQDDEEVRQQMQRRMISAMGGLDMQAYGASLVRAEYKATDLHQSKEFANPWFVVFQSAIDEMMERSAAAGKPHRISLVFDRQDEFKERAFRLFDQILTQPLPWQDRLGGLAFEAKDQIAALQAVDVVAYEINRHIQEPRLGPKAARWQLQLLRDCIPVGGRVWDKDGLRLLTQEIGRVE